MPTVLARAQRVAQEMQIGDAGPRQPLQRVDDLAFGAAWPERSADERGAARDALRFGALGEHRAEQLEIAVDILLDGRLEAQSCAIVKASGNDRTSE